MKQIANKKKLKGFTLIELLVVIFIMSLISGYIMLRSSNKPNFRELKSYAALIKSQMEVARQQSILQMTLLGLVFTKNAYSFYYLNTNKIQGNEWLKLSSIDSFWKDYHLPEWINVNIKTDKANFYKSTEQKFLSYPDILFLPNGEITPFNILIYTNTINTSVKIIGAASGSITIQEMIE